MFSPRRGRAKPKRHGRARPAPRGRTCPCAKMYLCLVPAGGSLPPSLPSSRRRPAAKPSALGGADGPADALPVPPPARAAAGPPAWRAPGAVNQAPSPYTILHYTSARRRSSRGGRRLGRDWHRGWWGPGAAVQRAVRRRARGPPPPSPQAQKRVTSCAVGGFVRGTQPGGRRAGRSMPARAGRRGAQRAARPAAPPPAAARPGRPFAA
jgi:hypothetical protein